MTHACCPARACGSLSCTHRRLQQPEEQPGAAQQQRRGGGKDELGSASVAPQQVDHALWLV